MLAATPNPNELNLQTPNQMSLKTFLDEFGEGLFDAVSTQNQPMYTGQTCDKHQQGLASLTRTLFEPQAKAVGAVMELLVNRNQPAAIINGEMGTGKTMMSIAIAALMHTEGYKRTIVLCPPHLVYKWRREILSTVPNARVWILNGTDTLAKLVKMRELFRSRSKTDDVDNVPEFFVLGRIRMRMGFHWRTSYFRKQEYQRFKRFDEQGKPVRDIEPMIRFTCPSCGQEIRDVEGKLFEHEWELKAYLSEERRYCQALLPAQKDKTGKLLDEKICSSPLWTLCRKDNSATTPYQRTFDALKKLPTIGEKTAQKLLDIFGEEAVSEILENNVMAFANMMDHNGNFVFTDAQARRLERALGKIEFSTGQGGYQPTEFVKRYLPKNYFGLLICDEAHEYKV